jgi:transcription antitermination protein NusB
MCFDNCGKAIARSVKSIPDHPLRENQQESIVEHAVRGTRRKGRELALQALYQIEITGDSSVSAVDLFLRHFEGTAQAKEFARRLVSGVVSQHAEIDRMIEESTENWKLARLAKVDLVILRVATYEMVHCPDIPSAVSLDEAIEIAKRFGNEESAKFINGVLDQIAESRHLKTR